MDAEMKKAEEVEAAAPLDIDDEVKEAPARIVAPIEVGGKIDRKGKKKRQGRAL